jgi:Protein of unknown function (DUF3370)
VFRGKILSLLFLSPIAQVNIPIDRSPGIVQPESPSRQDGTSPLRSLPSLPLPPQEPSQPPLPKLQKQEQVRRQEVRALLGQIDQVPVFNSNSPEVVLTEGILLSTFAPNGMRIPSAHLNYAFNGRFDIFAHHISRAGYGSHLRTLFQGILLHNPGDKPATVEVLQASTYLTRPEARFIDLPQVVEDPLGRVFSGPGSRVVGDVLRGHRNPAIARTLTIPPKTTQLLLNMPIPAGVTTPTSNGRSTLMRLNADQPIHVANLAMFAPQDPGGRERVPTLEEWQNLLVKGELAGPRDRPPTPLDNGNPNLIYGRVAGVSTGSQWTTQLVDGNTQTLAIPSQGQAFSYGISLLHNGRFGTGQIQSAPLLARYPDTAYVGNGNYGVQYNLTLPLQNKTNQPQTVSLSLDTPIKQDKTNNLLLFLSPPEPRIFFRGPVRIRYQDDRGVQQTRYFHIVQRRGEQGGSLLDLHLGPNESRSIEVNVLYPPDATPPQLLTITTQGGSGAIAEQLTQKP